MANNKVTPLGKHLRCYRIDNDMILKDMADSIGVSSAFLSASELGKRSISPEKLKELSENYPGLCYDQLYHLWVLSVPKIKIDLVGCDNETREIVALFAKKFDSLTDEQCKQVMSIIEKKV